MTSILHGSVETYVLGLFFSLFFLFVFIIILLFSLSSFPFIPFCTLNNQTSKIFRIETLIVQTVVAMDDEGVLPCNKLIYYVLQMMYVWATTREQT